MVFAACVPDNSPVMQPGESCISCHDDPDNARTWTVAGTVFGQADADTSSGHRDVQVIVTDAGGQTLTLNSNSAGNFYTAEPLQFPISVAVQKNGVLVEMAGKPPHGDCNQCHTIPPTDDAVGRVFIPE